MWHLPPDAKTQGHPRDLSLSREGRECRFVGVGTGIEKSFFAKLKLIYVLCIVCLLGNRTEKVYNSPVHTYIKRVNTLQCLQVLTIRTYIEILLIYNGYESNIGNKLFFCRIQLHYIDLTFQTDFLEMQYLVLNASKQK